MRLGLLFVRGEGTGVDLAYRLVGRRRGRGKRIVSQLRRLSAIFPRNSYMRQQSCGAVWRGHQEGASFRSVTESHVWVSLIVGHVSMNLLAG